MPAGRGRLVGRLTAVVAVPLGAGACLTAVVCLHRGPSVVVVVPAFRLTVVGPDDVR